MSEHAVVTEEIRKLVDAINSLAADEGTDEEYRAKAAQLLADGLADVQELADEYKEGEQEWKGVALLWQREICEALGIPVSERKTVLDKCKALVRQAELVRKQWEDVERLAFREELAERVRRETLEEVHTEYFKDTAGSAPFEEWLYTQRALAAKR